MPTVCRDSQTDPFCLFLNYSGTITLTAGQRYSIRMEYFQGTGEAIAALLWSSPSQGKAVIPSSQLIAARPANGLQATYYNGINLTGTSAIQTDPTINFAWNGASPAAGIPGEWFSARWEGEVVPRYSETYTFYTQTDDGARLWVNGQLLVDDWNYHGTVEHSGTITLMAGQSYDIRMEYFQGSAGAVAVLLWSSASQGKEVIPSSQLFVPSASGNYRSNALNQYTSVGGQTLDYDARFNLKSYGGASFTYNAQNQLISGTKGTNTVQFIYDGLGRCLKRTTNGASIIFAYDGWKPTAEWAADGSYWGFRIYGAGPDEVLWHYDSRIGYMRVHSDVHGNVIALLDWYGNGVEKYTYDAYGKPTITDWAGNVRTTSSVWNRFMFQGREYIPELGIYDYRHRMYVPALGRFLQTDPTGFDAGDMNLFRYCDDDPVDRSDPTGLESPSKQILPDRQFEMACRYDSGNSFQGSLDEFLKRLQPAGNITFAGQWKRDDGAKAEAPRVSFGTSAHERSMEILSEETQIPNADQTGAITNGQPPRVGPVSGEKVPLHPGHPSLGFRDTRIENLKWKGSAAAAVIHYHSYGHGKSGRPTDSHDIVYSRENPAIPVYFTNIELAKHGNYEIIKAGRESPLFYDPRIIPR